MSLQSRLAQAELSKVEQDRHNAISAFQAILIAPIERDYAMGVISPAEYKRLYADASALIREFTSKLQS